MNQQSLDYVTCACFSGLITKTSCAPLDRIRLIYQTQGMMNQHSKHYGSIFQTVGTVVREEGVGGLWRGNGANLVRATVVYILKFSVNDTIKANLKAKSTNRNAALSVGQLLAAGSVAGLVQKVASFPFDLVTVRIALGVNAQRLGGHGYSSIPGTFKQVVKSEGIKGLYKGFCPTLVTGVPYVALQMTFFDLVKRDGEYQL
eukprot:Platyproteum_vivax@DN2668_c0_g1_i1.p1